MTEDYVSLCNDCRLPLVIDNSERRDDGLWYHKDCEANRKACDEIREMLKAKFPDMAQSEKSCALKPGDEEGG